MNEVRKAHSHQQNTYVIDLGRVNLKVRFLARSVTWDKDGEVAKLSCAHLLSHFHRRITASKKKSFLPARMKLLIVKLFLTFKHLF